jgi:pimeloyl-ACP methyl ester carboxylesterase
MIVHTCGRVATAALERAGRAVMELVDGEDPPASARPGGASAPVVLVGGMAATEPVLLPLARRLERRGHEVATVTSAAGLGCAESAVDVVTERIVEVAARTGERVGVVGHSRGGQFARVAVGRPAAAGCVASLVTLGSPFDLYGLRWPLLAQAAGVVAAGTLGVPGLARLSCLGGRCCRGFRAGLRAPVPAAVRVTSISSRRDAAVPWRASADPWAHNVEVTAGHLAMLTDPDAVAAVSTALTVPSGVAAAA